MRHERQNAAAADARTSGGARTAAAGARIPSRTILSGNLSPPRFPIRNPQPAIRNPQSPPQGFTLLEVLVVVAIIALLAAVLVPALGRARVQARRTACTSNLHQIAVAWHQYLDANAGRFFQITNANYNYGGIQGSGDPQFGSDPLQPIPKPLNTHLRLKPIIREGGTVFLCPADTGGDVEKPTIYSYYGTSYATTVFLIGQERLNIISADPCRSVMLQINRRLKGISRSSISNEPRLLLIGDFGWVHTYSFLSDVVIDWHAQRHTHHMAFLDGHVEFIRIRKGLHVTDRYTVIPFRDLHAAAIACQQEVPCD
jgi:prepilin-type N-terminal cleavage/methylation domain-containing protein/prepilin-type processing-associated H-X9-DG protein